jgi:enediyne biosynthesis protein E4
VSSGTNYAINSMGIGIADYDHDMDYDFALSNIGPTLLARNNGDGTFTEVAKAAGVARPFQNAHEQSVTWGLDFADLNLDGWEDLFVAAGPIGGEVGQPNEVFANVGGGRFADLSAPSGITGRGLNRGVGFADFDRDGRVDLYVVNMAGFSRLYRNVTPSAGLHWLEVKATGTASNRDGCGARLRLAAAGRTLLRDVFCGSTSFASSNDHVVHFGLGSASTVDSLVIQWSSGITQTLGSMAVDQLVEVTEP